MSAPATTLIGGSSPAVTIPVRRPETPATATPTPTNNSVVASDTVALENGVEDPNEDNSGRINSLTDAYGGEDTAETGQAQADDENPFGEGVKTKTFEVEKWEAGNAKNSTVDGILRNHAGVDPDSEDGQKLKAEVARVNGLDENFTLQPGQELKIPDLTEAQGESKPPRDMSAEEIAALPAEQRNQMATQALADSNQAWNQANEGFGALSEDQKIEAGEFIGDQLGAYSSQEGLELPDGSTISLEQQLDGLREGNPDLTDEQMGAWEQEFMEMAKMNSMATWAENQMGEGVESDGLAAMAEGAGGYTAGRADFLSLAPNLAGEGF